MCNYVAIGDISGTVCIWIYYIRREKYCILFVCFWIMGILVVYMPQFKSIWVRNFWGIGIATAEDDNQKKPIKVTALGISGDENFGIDVYQRVRTGKGCGAFVLTC